MRFAYWVVACGLFLDVSRGQDASKRLTLGTVQDEGNADGGGRCSLQLPRDYSAKEGHFVFVADFRGHGIVNVDGADHHIGLVKFEGADLKVRGDSGERSHYTYTGDGLEVEVDYLATGGCARGDDSCRVGYYDATLTVKRGKMHKTVAAKGVCGG